MTVGNNSTTSLYKYFDVTGVLIYVGITSQASSRNKQHNSDKKWWPFVHSQTVEHYDTREEALIAERSEILRHRPPFNVQHNAHYKDIQSGYLIHAVELSHSKPPVEWPKTIEFTYRGPHEERYQLLASTSSSVMIASRFKFTNNCCVSDQNKNLMGIVKSLKIHGPFMQVVVRPKTASFRPGMRFTGEIKGARNNNQKFLELRRITLTSDAEPSDGAV